MQCNFTFTKTELVYNIVMSNVFDQALETAMGRTSAWVRDQESMGMVVTEQMAANKFRVIYEQILLNTEIDVLNF